ncbi:MAG: hypothetical protein AB7K35_06890 [Pseudorhodoplanes sp.]
MIDIPESALRARDLYAAGATTREIMRATGFARAALYFWIDGGPKCEAGADSPRLLPPLGRRKARPRLRRNARTELIARMMRAAERQVKEIEERIGSTDDDTERAARALAVLARTLRELTALDALHRGRERRKKTVRSHDEPFPRDIGELRRSLADKLERIIARREG